MNTFSDFVIVGGGGIGCATAYHLAKAGRSVTVLEAEAIGSGASGGLGKRAIRANSRDLREMHLIREAYDLWPVLDEELGGPTGFQRTGYVSLVENEVTGSRGGMVALQTHMRAHQCSGIPAEAWDQETVRTNLRGVSPTVKAGLLTPLDGMTSQQLTTESYAAAARSLGAEIREHCRVDSVTTDRQGRAVAVVTSEGERLPIGETLLLANNYGAVELAFQSFGVSVPAWRMFPLAMTVESEEPADLPVLVGHDSRPIAIKAIDGLWMLSGGWRGRWNPQTQRGELDEVSVQGNIRQLQAVFPELGPVKIIEADASRAETSSADQIPLIDKIPGSANAFLATGWAGHGWALVPAVTGYLAEMLIGGHMPGAFGNFGLSRFGVLNSAQRSIWRNR